jgi:hypothetical protein
VIKLKESSKINFYNDKSPSVEFEPELLAILLMKGLVSNSGRKLVSFCGFIIRDNTVNIFLPREILIYNYDINEKLAMAADLMRGIDKYGKNSKTSINSNENGDNVINLGSLSLIRYLFDDYARRGLYSQKIKTSTLNNGKPNWKKTVSGFDAYPNKSNQMVYLNTHCTKSQTQSSNLIASIQANVLSTLDLNFSWLITGKHGYISPELRSIQQPFGNKTWQITMLKRELSLVYAENDVKLISSLIRCLESDIGLERNEYFCGLTDFHYAWESMLNSVLSNTIPLNSLLPAPVYVKNDGSLQSEAKRNMRIDICLEHPDKKHIVIIDAKYYGAGSGEVPGWPDLVKQFFYEKAVSLIYDDKYTFSNIFVFPGQSGPFKYVVMKDRESDDYYPEIFPPISCMYICPSIVISHYVKGEIMMDFVRQLMSVCEMPELETSK